MNQYHYALCRIILRLKRFLKNSRTHRRHEPSRIKFRNSEDGSIFSLPTLLNPNSVEEPLLSEISVTMAEQAESQKVEETLSNNVHDKSQASGEAALESESGELVTVESSAITSQNTAETSAPTSDADHEKTLDYADKLMEEGYKAMKDNDFGEAAENFSRALEIRVANFGELAPECVQTYYKYGCALLYKSQEEADPLGDVPKKEGGESQQGSTKDGSVKNSIAESSTASVSSNVEQDADSNNQDAALDDGECDTINEY